MTITPAVVSISSPPIRRERQQKRLVHEKSGSVNVQVIDIVSLLSCGVGIAGEDLDQDRTDSPSTCDW